LDLGLRFCGHSPLFGLNMVGVYLWAVKRVLLFFLFFFDLRNTLSFISL